MVVAAAEGRPRLKVCRGLRRRLGVRRGGKIRIPVLGSDDDLDELKVVDDELRYYDHSFPLAEGTYTSGDNPREVHARQHYELVGWRRADADLNYRRFFAVNTLAGVRVEVPWVFDESHEEIVRWFREGLVDGLRIDHPDGLADPEGYLARLREVTGGALTCWWRRSWNRGGSGCPRPSTAKGPQDTTPWLTLTAFLWTRLRRST